ncbi:MAG: FtsX-like permease family protein [Bryobacteraceae bacterium]|nr:FtsX-like permease family protein [Bryobacteraceae bacterium]
MRAFELFVAARYLRAKRRQAVLGVITVISVAGVAAGVMALVIALAINNGFRSTLETTLLGATPHVVLLEKEPGEGITGWRGVAQKMQTLPGVKSAAPALYGKVFLAGPMQSAEATLKGVLPESIEWRHAIREGSLDRLSEDRTLVIGAPLARRTGMTLNSWITVVSPQGELTPLGPRALQVRYHVVAIFETGYYDIDNSYAVTSLENAQRLFSLGDVANAIELKVGQLDEAPAIAAAAESAAGPALGATHWMEQNRQLLGALKMERTVSMVTISLIQLVAALNILTALVMAVMEKRRDIAVLISMGARQAQIARIFVTQGLMIGAAGAALGLIAGYTLSWCAGHYQWFPLDEEIYSMAFVPFEPRLLDALWIAAVALGVSLLATLHPARSAARIDPVETLRYE